MQQLNKNISQFPKDSIIYTEGEETNQICLLIKGRVIVEGIGVKSVLYSGSFLGVQDIINHKYAYTYRAMDDVVICTFTVDNIEELLITITDNPDYCGLITASLCKQLCGMVQSQNDMIQCANELYQSIHKFSKAYTGYAYEYKSENEELKVIKQLKLFEIEPLSEKLSYYMELNNFSVESVRSFFSQGNLIVRYHVNELSQLMNEQYKKNCEVIDYIASTLSFLIGNSKDCIFYKYADLCKIAESRGDSAQILSTLDEIIDKINQCENMVEQASNKNLYIDRKLMEETYYNIISGADSATPETLGMQHMSDEQLIETTRNSLIQILNYAGMDQKFIDEFITNLKQYQAIQDKFALSDSFRSLRKDISEAFYVIYEKVFFKAYNDFNKPVAIELFLKYGFMDETLITVEQLIELWRINIKPNKGKFKIYNIYDWLRLIYEEKKVPSKNEFDLNYSEVLRTELNQKKISEEEYQLKLNNPYEKLHFEIVNMFKYNNRISSGKITTFIPILQQDSIIGSLEKMYMSAQKIGEALQLIINIDYSLFYREISYVNKEENIEKEYIMEQCYPEFILMPSIGSKGFMWQDISERRRNTPARFILPTFLETNLNDVMVRLCAKFRWEICRTIQGATWNNIKYKSLTSEYVDYIQFYKKNRDLSEERKEKIKSQIQKYANRLSDIFASDYEVWVKSEATGAVRLNKVVRKILAIYCPFEKSIRTRLITQPVFTDVIQAYEIERQKKVREISNHYKSLENKNIRITEILQDHLDFYQNM